MGFYYHEMDCQLIIPAKNIPEAANTLRHMLQNGVNAYSDGIDVTLDDADLIAAVAEDDGWYGHVGEDGTLLNPCMMNGKKTGGDGTDWLQTLAPYIEDGSYVQIRDDDDRVYRVCFFDGKTYTVYPVWPSSKEEVMAQEEEEA